MIAEALNHFKAGNIVIFPTDTIYGIGCRLSNKESIKKIYSIRRDVPSKPQLILAASFDQASQYGFFEQRATKLAKTFWPGPLTIVVQAKPSVPKIIQGSSDTIGIRVPNQPPILKIIKSLGEPIIAPSANFHGEKAPTSFAEIDKKFLALVDYAINLTSQEGFLPLLKRPSTVVDLTKKPYKIIRLGVISEEQIKEALGGA